MHTMICDAHIYVGYYNRKGLVAARSGESLTVNMRRSVAKCNRLAGRIDFAGNFHRYLKGCE